MYLRLGEIQHNLCPLPGCLRIYLTIGDAYGFPCTNIAASRLYSKPSHFFNSHKFSTEYRGYLPKGKSNPVQWLITLTTMPLNAVDSSNFQKPLLVWYQIAPPNSQLIVNLSATADKIMICVAMARVTKHGFSQTLKKTHHMKMTIVSGYNHTPLLAFCSSRVVRVNLGQSTNIVWSQCSCILTNRLFFELNMYRISLNC